MLQSSGVRSVRLPSRSPNLNAFAERFVHSIKEACLERVVPLGEAYLCELRTSTCGAINTRGRTKASEESSSSAAA